MKKTAVVLAAVAVIFAGFALYAEDSPQQTTGQASSSSGAEVVVKGQLKIKIDSDKPEINPVTDINEVAESVVKTEDTFLGISPEDVKDVRASIPQNVYEARADYNPAISMLEQPPIFVLNPKIPASIELEEWMFKVTDASGATVYKLKGNGRLPERIVWDGFDENGRILKVGSPYIYKLTYIDKAGVPGSKDRDKPKIVNAIKYSRDGKMIIEASHGLLFQAKRKDKLSDEGKRFVKEVQDYFKMANKFPVTIKIYSNDPETASDQAATFEKVFTDDLKLPKSFFKVEPYQDQSVPKNYRTVFMIQG